MFDFEKALRADRGWGIPTSVASGYFLEMTRGPAPEGHEKTAGWQDPPDETGVLEGQFEVPLEYAVQLMGNCAMHLLRLMSAGLIYSGSIRGNHASEVRCAIKCNEWDHKTAFEYLVERMTVLAGAPHIPEADMPPPSINPVDVAKRMIRAEQEMIHAYSELIAVLGGNPMKECIKEKAARCQKHLDELWMALPPELGTKPTLPRGPSMLARHEQTETPEQEAAESPEFQQAEEAAGVEAHEEKTAGVLPEFLANGATYPVALKAQRERQKNASVVGAMVKWAKRNKTGPSATTQGVYTGTLGGGLIGGLAAPMIGVDPLVGAGVGAGVGAVGGGLVGNRFDARGNKTASVDEELREKGRQRAVANVASSQESDRARRGERAGKALGAAAGVFGGGALGRKLIGGKSGTIAGAALGGLAGRQIGGEIGNEVDIARVKSSSAQAPGWGETIGEVGGSIGGGGLGALAGGLAGSPTGPGAVIAGGAGMTAGSMAGGALGKRIGRGVDSLFSPGEKKKMASAVNAMVAWVKQAQEPMAMEQEAGMASPTDERATAPLNYMRAEEIGRQAQEQSEAEYHKQRANQAIQQAQQVSMEAEQRTMEAESMAAEATAEASVADQKVQDAMSQAIAAKEEAIAQTEEAAKIHMATQDMRLQLMQLAKQDPVANAMIAVAGNTPAEPLGGGAPGDAPPDGGMNPGLDPNAGAAGGAAAPNTPPGAAPPEGEADMNAPAGGPPGPPPAMAQQTSKMSSIRIPIKLAGIPVGLTGGALGGLGGAAQGVYDAHVGAQEGLEPVQAKLTELQQSQDGTFGKALQLARAKSALADRELAVAHPRSVMAHGALKGSVKGALMGALLEKRVRFLAGD